MMKKTSRVLTALLASAMLLSACSGGGESSTASSTASSGATSTADESGSSETFDPMAKYDETITVKLCGSMNSADDYDGYTIENSPWTEMLLNDYNIKLEYMWTVGSADDYRTRMDLAIASNEMPDIIHTANYSQFDKLARAGRLKDITGMFEEYIRPEYQEFVLQANPQALEYGTYDGVTYGVTVAGPNYNNGRMVMIRADWMEQLNIEEPTTMEEVIEIGKRFVDEGLATYALPLNKDVMITSDMCDITAVANAYGAYPKIWIDDGNGGLKYGTVQPEMKDAIQVYANLYADGYIDPAFASLDGNTVAESMTSNQFGIMMGPFWLITWPLNSNYELDGVTWNCYPVPASETFDGKMLQQVPAASGAYFAVNAEFDHPEALFKILNAVTDKLTDPDPEVQATFHSYQKEDGNSVGIHMLNPLGEYIGDPRINPETNTHVTQAIDNNDESYLVSSHDILQYPKVKQYFDDLEAGVKPSTDNWCMYMLFYGDTSCYAIINDYLSNDSYISCALNGYTTDTMNLQWENMKMIEDQYVVEMISGTRDVESGFDEFVSAWEDMGGTTIVEEVNEWYKSR